MHEAATLNKLGSKTHHKNEKEKKIHTAVSLLFVSQHFIMTAETVDFSSVLCLRLKKVVLM